MSVFGGKKITPDVMAMIGDMGKGLLAASGPSRVPVSFGQAMLSGMQSMDQGQQRRNQQRMGNEDARLRRELLRAQLAKAQSASKRNIMRDAAGYVRDVDSGARVFPDAMVPQKHLGGATDYIVSKAMENPDYASALYNYQTGWRQGTQRGLDGSVQATPGAPEALGQIEYGKKSGQQSAVKDYAQSIEQQKILGKERGAKTATLASMQAKLPELQNVVAELGELGKKATYTVAGRVADTVTRELGMEPGEGAVARAEYMAKIDNQTLPLLRDTFGAAFTQAEGQWLRSTLGDANKSPEEKQAALNAFIEQKMRDVTSMQAELGQQAPSISMDGQLMAPAGAVAAGAPRSGDLSGIAGF